MRDDITIIEFIYVTSCFCLIFLLSHVYELRLTEYCKNNKIYEGYDRSKYVHLRVSLFLVLSTVWLCGMFWFGQKMGVM